ncbi:MAG: CHAP domain-containing protein [Actinobacteria bacterium]|nr:CHAP domain-containing protein [Actinomycetota bacterium]
MRGSRRMLLPLAVAGAVATAVLLIIAAVVAAIFGASASCLGAGAGPGVTRPAPAGKAVQEIPPARLRLYVGAGARFDISWLFLASIGVQECGYDGHCGVAPSGCAGVMEIAYVRGSACSPDPSVPTIWERFKVDADGGGASILDPADSIFTAARILRRSMGAPPAGGPYLGYREAACDYYGACSSPGVPYADEVMARAVEFGFGHEGAPGTAGGSGARSVAALMPEQGHGHGVSKAAAPQGTACGRSTTPSTGGPAGTAIVRVARSQLGTSEVPMGSNCTRYGPCEEWCALFVAWVWQRAGVAMAGGTAPYAYSGTFYGWVKEHGGRVLPPGATPAPGDAVLYGWGPTASEHVGIVEAVLGGEITTIEGNFGNRVSRVGPFPPALAVADGEPAPIYAYAEPPALAGGGGRS